MSGTISWRMSRRVLTRALVACALGAGSLVVAVLPAQGRAQQGSQPQQPQFAIDGQKLVREGKLDDALALYKKVLQTSPESAIANSGAGVVLDLKGQYADARKYFQRAIDVASNPQDKAVAQRQMAMSYAFEGDCKKSSQYEQKVVDYWASQNKFFDQGEAANEAARVCIDAGDLDAAEKWYRMGHDLGVKEPNISPDRADLWAFRWEHAQARLAARRGKIDEAQKHVVAAKEILDKGTNPQQAPFFPYLVGYVAFYSGDYAAALVAFEKANQNDPFILCMIAQTYEKQGDKEKAAPFYAKAASTTAHNPAGAYAHRVAGKKAS
jgi:tetratricopeptide (TPR) repeat protein